MIDAPGLFERVLAREIGPGSYRLIPRRNAFGISADELFAGKFAARNAARGLAPDWPILRVLGLSEFTAHLRGDMTLDAALDLARQKTRNYAKRQTTWFRNQF